MNRFKRAVLLLLVFQTMMVFGKGTGEASSGESLPLQQITLGILPDVASIPFVIAELKGYFIENGIQVKIQQFKNPVDRDTAFQAGESDLVISDLLAAALFRDGGFAVKALSLTNGSYKLLAAPGSSAKEFKDLAGGRIGISRNTIIEYATDRMLTASGMSREDIRKEVIPRIPIRLQMLSAGKIDGATLPEPLATAAVVQGSTVIMSSDKLGINPGILLCKEDFIKEHGEALTAFFRGYNKAVDYIRNTDKEEFIDTLVEVMGFPPAARDKMELPAYTAACAPPQKEVEEVVTWLGERELVASEESYDDMVDSSCLP